MNDSTRALTFAVMLALPCLATCADDAERPTKAEMMEKKMTPSIDEAENGVDRVSKIDLPPENLVAGIEPGVPATLLDAIRSDAAERGKSAADNVRIVLARQETWPTGAMGCPMPGEVYTQMTTRGYHIVAAVGLKKFDYRAGENGRFLLCDTGRIQKPIPKQ